MDRRFYNIKLLRDLHTDNDKFYSQLIFNNYNTFIMLDYFSLLLGREIDISASNANKIIFGSKDGFQSKEYSFHETASQFINVYDENENDSDIIFNKNDNISTLSDKPFLLLIQVNIRFKFYEKSSIKNDPISFINNARIDLVKEIERIKIKYNLNKEDIYYKVLNSITSGDFYIYLKMAKLSDYVIIINSLKQSINQGVLWLDTFSILGIECFGNFSEEKGITEYLTFSEKFNNLNISSNFELKFICSNQFIDRIRNSDKFDGVCGTYDVKVCITIEQLRNIYPALCRFTLEKRILIDDFKTGYDELLDLIFEGLKSKEISLIKCISFIGFKEVNLAKNIINLPDNRGNNIELFSEHTSITNELINEFYNNRIHFLRYRLQYNNCFNLLLELKQTFDPIFFIKDEFINWKIFLEHKKSLLYMIRYYCLALNFINDENSKNKVCEKILSDLTTAINTLNSFNKHVHNINIESIFSPNYEIQAQVDIEKQLISYSLYMRSIIEAIPREVGKTYSNHHYFTLPNPYMTTDISQDFVTARPLLFAGDLDINVESQVLNNWNDKFKGPLLAITTPSIAQFSRIYHLLPWVTHEACHYVNPCSSEERNNFTLKYIIKHLTIDIAAYICKINYINFNDYNDNIIILISNILKNIINEDFRKSNHLYNEYFYQNLIENLYNCILKYTKQYELTKKSCLDIIKQNLIEFNSLIVECDIDYNGFQIDVNNRDLKILLEKINIFIQINNSTKVIDIRKNIEKHNLNFFHFDLNNNTRKLIVERKQKFIKIFDNIKNMFKLIELIENDTLYIKIFDEIKNTKLTDEEKNKIIKYFDNCFYIDKNNIKFQFNSINKEFINIRFPRWSALYRDITSDILMCEILKFDYLGYTKFCLGHLTNYGLDNSNFYNEKNESYTDLSRFNTVISYLYINHFQNDEPNLIKKNGINLIVDSHKLQDNLIEYIIKRLEYIYKLILKDINKYTFNYIRDKHRDILLEIISYHNKNKEWIKTKLAAYALNRKNEIYKFDFYNTIGIKDLYDIESFKFYNDIEEKQKNNIFCIISKRLHLIKDIKLLLISIKNIMESDNLQIDENDYNQYKKYCENAREKLVNNKFKIANDNLNNSFSEKYNLHNNIPDNKMINNTIDFIKYYYYKSRLDNSYKI